MDQTRESIRDKISRLAKEFTEGPFLQLGEKFIDDEGLAMRTFFMFFQGGQALRVIGTLPHDPEVIDAFINEHDIRQADSLVKAAEFHLKSHHVSILTAEEADKEEDLKTKLCNQSLLIAKEIVSNMELMLKTSKSQTCVTA